MASDFIQSQCWASGIGIYNLAEWNKSQFDQGLESVADAAHEAAAVIHQIRYSILDRRIAEEGGNELAGAVRFVTAGEAARNEDHLGISQCAGKLVNGAGNGFRIQAPLQYLSKAQIIQAGVARGVDYGLTVSCYQADEQGRACGKCDSCRLRADGFAAAGISDPTPYF